MPRVPGLHKETCVLVDMDDVLADLLVGWVSVLNDTHNLTMDPKDMDVWDLKDSLEKAGSALTEEQIFKPFNEPGLFRNLPVIIGAKEALYSMKMMGLTPVIVTSLPMVKHSPGVIVREKLEWIDEHLPDLIHPRDVIFTYRKELVEGIALIDDAPHNIERYPGSTILFGNRGGDCNYTYKANNWDEAMAALESLIVSKGE